MVSINTFFKFQGIDFCFLRRNPNRVFTDHVPRSVDRINANVHHAPPPESCFIQSPLGGITDGESAKALEEYHFSKLAGLRICIDLKCFGFKMHAVTNQQFYIGRFACIHHLLPLFSIYGHWLFADHMLAGFRHANHLVVMQPVGSDHIHCIDVGIVFYVVEILIVVTILFRDVIFALPVF